MKSRPCCVAETKKQSAWSRVVHNEIVSQSKIRIRGKAANNEKNEIALVFCSFRIFVIVNEETAVKRKTLQLIARNSDANRSNRLIFSTQTKSLDSTLLLGLDSGCWDSLDVDRTGFTQWKDRFCRKKASSSRDRQKEYRGRTRRRSDQSQRCSSSSTGTPSRRCRRR